VGGNGEEGVGFKGEASHWPLGLGRVQGEVEIMAVTGVGGWLQEDDDRWTPPVIDRKVKGLTPLEIYPDGPWAAS
jgi:hypothetical protein